MCCTFELCLVANNIQPTFMYGYCVDALLWKTGDWKLAWKYQRETLENKFKKQRLKCYNKTIYQTLLL